MSRTTRYSIWRLPWLFQLTSLPSRPRGWKPPSTPRLWQVYAPTRHGISYVGSTRTGSTTNVSRLPVLCSGAPASCNLLGHYQTHRRSSASRWPQHTSGRRSLPHCSGRYQPTPDYGREPARRRTCRDYPSCALARPRRVTCSDITRPKMNSTPTTFGAHNSQAIIGIQMAAAYVGTTLAPPLFGA
jgi:hypothetical protein